jgi:hypothetical protein
MVDEETDSSTRVAFKDIPGLIFQLSMNILRLLLWTSACDSTILSRQRFRGNELFDPVDGWVGTFDQSNREVFMGSAIRSKPSKTVWKPTQRYCVHRLSTLK